MTTSSSSTDRGGRAPLPFAVATGERQSGETPTVADTPMGMLRGHEVGAASVREGDAARRSWTADKTIVVDGKGQRLPNARVNAQAV